ncbi:MAG: hypothetical protein OXI63_25005 [Candidatus Poribacteria bacterium]|nr:hypothetical protein [Candidatus Poribacteria bacterium]
MSSTEVRELLARGEAIEHLVPPSILTMLDVCRADNEKAHIG